VNKEDRCERYLLHLCYFDGVRLSLNDSQLLEDSCKALLYFSCILANTVVVEVTVTIEDSLNDLKVLADSNL
jgi:hypothetical protein